MPQKLKFRSYIQLKIDQECDEDMSEQKMIEWVESYFEGCDYGQVKATLLAHCQMNIPLTK